MNVVHEYMCVKYRRKYRRLVPAAKTCKYPDDGLVPISEIHKATQFIPFFPKFSQNNRSISVTPRKFFPIILVHNCIKSNWKSLIRIWRELFLSEISSGKNLGLFWNLSLQEIGVFAPSSKKTSPKSLHTRGLLNVTNSVTYWNSNDIMAQNRALFHQKKRR